jgi:hypothetical protein
MKTFLRYWNTLWFSQLDPLPAAVCRIMFGMLLLYAFIGNSIHWDRFFDANGMLSLNDADLVAQRPATGWNVFQYTDGLLPTRFWWFVGFSSILALIVGWQTRIATIAMYVLISSMVHRNPLVVNGEELVSRLILLYACFCPWGHALSIDAWLWQRKHPGETRALPVAWSVRMMQISIMSIYVISLPYKFAQDIGWLTGDALHWTVSGDMWWMRGFLPEISYEYGGLFRKLLTWGTVLIEGLVPIGVCFRRTQILSVAAMMSLHIGIALLVPGVTLFTLSMVAAATLFLPPEFYRAVAAGFQTRVKLMSNCLGFSHSPRLSRA